MIDGLTKAVTVIDDIFSNEDCDDLIRYFEERRSEARIRPEPSKLAFLPIVDFQTNLPVDEMSRSKVMKVFSHLGPNVRIQRAHVELRENGALMPYHVDEANKSVVFTSVTYLNADFSGGFTRIRPHGEESSMFDTAIAPRKGRTVFFDGVHFLHSVTETSGDRFTMPIWYRLLPGDFPEKHKWWV